MAAPAVPALERFALMDSSGRTVLEGKVARAGLVLPDGIGIKIGSALLGTPLKQNVNGTDLFPRLCELLQARGEPVPEYVVIGELGPAHRKGFRVECRLPGGQVAAGEGFSKKAAQQEAARAALQLLRGASAD